ncbi:MAG: hypothetical protein BGO90_14945 [Legionella sp. 40-6]|nr:hypothetical protein [Legionella sp.]OJY39453.1 MAG: hypothetical protein BGO90_14945 [Legionella sp. 40-6]
MKFYIHGINPETKEDEVKFLTDDEYAQLIHESEASNVGFIIEWSEIIDDFKNNLQQCKTNLSGRARLLGVIDKLEGSTLNNEQKLASLVASVIEEYTLLVTSHHKGNFPENIKNLVETLWLFSYEMGLNLPMDASKDMNIFTIPSECIHNEIQYEHLIKILYSHEMIARHALDYARSILFKGFTQLETNNYDSAQRAAIHSSIRTVRDNALESMGYFDEEDMITWFYDRVTQFRKLSLGNCHELAIMALDYVLNLPKKNVIRAEIFHIQNGDHVFLVIGRDELSIASSPETWGEQAYICDPWANKVYPAREYLTQLGDFFRCLTEDGLINASCPFDPETQSLEPIAEHNSSVLDQAPAKLEQKYMLRMQKLITNLEFIDQQLQQIEERLQKKYGADDRKIAVIQQMREEIKNTAFEQPGCVKNNNYIDYRRQLEQSWKNNLGLYKNTLCNLEAKKYELNYYRNEHSAKDTLLRFFKIAPKSARSVDYALSKAKQDTDDLLKP